MFLSIIIPVYNNENEIDRCIKSVLDQQFKDFELIIIDDGSTDLSYQKCNYYKNKDSRISVYRKNNGGVSSARNYGINYAKGTYITFIDADDYVERDYYSNIFTKEVDQDIVYTHYKIRNKQKLTNIYNKNLKCIANNPLDFKWLYQKAGGILKDDIYIDNTISVYIWRMCFKRSFLQENRIYFDEKLRYSEDRIFMMNCLLKAPTIFLKDNVFGYIHEVGTKNDSLSNLRDLTKYKPWMFEHQIYLCNIEQKICSENTFLTKEWKYKIKLNRANSMRMSLFINEFKYNKKEAKKNYDHYFLNDYFRWAYNLDNFLYCIKQKNVREILKFIIVKLKVYRIGLIYK